MSGVGQQRPERARPAEEKLRLTDSHGGREGDSRANRRQILQHLMPRSSSDWKCVLMREAGASSSEAELKHESAIVNVESMVDAEDLRELSAAPESSDACSASPEKADLNDMEFGGNSQFLNSKCVIEPN